MAEHITDEEQLESLKRWWKENGIGLLFTAALAVAGWFGWHAWQDHRQQLAEQGAQVFMQLQELQAQSADGNYNDQQRANLNRLASTLRDSFKSSQYGRYGALTLAKLAVESNDLDKAATELRWVMDRADDRGLELLARLRLARVESARGNHQQALELLNVGDTGTLTSSYAETRGDVYLRLEDSDQARAAYETALVTLPPQQANARQILDLKLSRVPASVAATDGENNGAAASVDGGS